MSPGGARKAEPPTTAAEWFIASVTAACAVHNLAGSYEHPSMRKKDRLVRMMILHASQQIQARPMPSDGSADLPALDANGRAIRNKP